MGLASKRTVLAAVFGMVVVLSSHARADYMITRLPGIEGGGSEAFGINAPGQVVGDEQFPRFFIAHLWNNARPMSLGIGPFSRAYGINASAQVIGNMDSHAFLWQNGHITDLGSGMAFGINDSGQIVGTSNGRALVWQNGALTDLGPGLARAINASGQIVGAGSNGHAVLWQNGTMTDLGTLGGNLSDATGINASGTVVGMSRLAGQISFNAFLWQNGTMTDLGPGMAKGINDSGLVVGQSSEDGPAVIWQNGVMTDLNTLIPADSGWMLRDATAVNDAGQIVGTGIYKDQGAFGFLLTPSQAPVPEPSTLALLTIGTLSLIAYAWRCYAQGEG